jgi:archaellum component FlaC
MALSDFDKTMKKNENVDDDFGFSAISSEEYEARINKAAEPIEEYKEKIQQLEKMVLPFLEKLRDTGDKEYIYWPNRKDAINKQIDKLLKITRG